MPHMVVANYTFLACFKNYLFFVAIRDSAEWYISQFILMSLPAMFGEGAKMQSAERRKPVFF